MKHVIPWTSLVLGICLFIGMSYLSSSFKPDELGLGRNTTGHIAYFNNKRLSGISNAIDSVKFFMNQQVKVEQNNNLCLWLGNSQLHSINYYQPGNRLAVEYTNKLLAENGDNTTVYQFSCPHLNIIEELLFISEIRNMGINPKVLILPVTYRSFHFTTIRSELKSLTGYKNVEKIITDNKLKEIYRYEIESDERGKLKSEKKTWQDQSEESINLWFTNNFPLYQYRENTKSYFTYFPLQAIHFFSDKTKDLNVKGKEDAVALNIIALSTILDYAKNNNIKILLYQVPHPQDPNFFFYNRDAYNQFFDHIKKIASNYRNITFLDLSKLVELNLWGISNDGYKDTYHFKDKGHQLLGDTIAYTLLNISK